MKPPPSAAAMMQCALLLISILIQLSIVDAVCYVNFNFQCSSDYSATSNITFSLIDDKGVGVETYGAQVIFNWGPSVSDYESGNFVGFKHETVESPNYKEGTSYEIIRSHAFDAEGEYYVGHDVQFVEGANPACLEKDFSGAVIVWFDDEQRQCGFRNVEDEDFDFPEIEMPKTSPPKTLSPTQAPLTISPTTRAPITSTPTTKEPTNEPTKHPSAQPMTEPTEQPTNAPSKQPTKLQTLQPISSRSPSKNTITTPPSASPTLPSNCNENDICDPNEHAEICEADCAGIDFETKGYDEATEYTDADGTMFSVKPSRNVIIKSIDMYSTKSGIARVEVYTKPGSFEGVEMTFSEWTRVYDNQNVLKGGPLESTTLKLNNQQGVSVPADTIASFFIYTTYKVRCMMGDEVGKLAADDAILELYEGFEVKEKWGTTADSDDVVPLVFRGKFRYDVVESVPSLAPIPILPPVTSPPTLPSSGDTSIVPPVTSPPTMMSSSDIEAYLVKSVMTLYNSKMLDDESEKIWVDVTTEVIRQELSATTRVGLKLVEVNVVIDDSKLLEKVRRRNVMASAINAGSHKSWRHLQQQITTPLQIEFTTAMSFPSGGTASWDENDASELIASAFGTQAKQKAYMNELRGEDPSHFSSLESMSVEVDADLTTENEGPPTGTPDGAEGNDNDSKSSNMYYIIAAVVAGACIILFAMAIAIYVITRRKNAEIRNAKAGTNNAAAKDYDYSDNSPPVAMRDNVKGLYGLEVETKSDTMLDDGQPSPYIGTIESGDVDDVSTLGDPYMGEAVNPVMDADQTVAGSMADYTAYGVGRNQGGGTVGGGTIGTSTIGASKAFLFGDDPTLEDVYRNPDMGEGGDEKFAQITVVAPAGKLGIVLDNPHGDLPIIWAIKETSSLHGKVYVGDLLLSVDGVDVRGMSSHDVSSFLSSRSMNPSRTLVLARAS